MQKLYLLIVACLINLTGFGQSGTTGPLTWSITNDILTISGTGAMPDYTSIKAPWTNSFNQVIIEAGVASIGSSAFDGCRGLTSVMISNSVTSIGDWAFYKCSGLTSITIPNSVIYIGKEAFMDCSGITYLTIPNSVTSIGDGAFRYCIGIIYLTIPNSVTSIGNEAFMDCRRLTSITIPNSVTSIGKMVFYACIGLREVTIPNSVTSIGMAAFNLCYGIASITIPNSVTSIGSYAFQGCYGLTSITIPNSVTSIELGAFFECYGLRSLTIPNSVTSIGGSAFQGCSGLKDIYAERTTPADSYSSTFFDVDKSSCTLHVPVGSKQYYSVADGWKDFTVIEESGPVVPLTWTISGDTLTISGTGAMANYYKASEVPWYSYRSSITSVVINPGVTSIGDWAFDNYSRLTSITIPNSVTSIGANALRYCSGLTSISIPGSVTRIGNSAFRYCSGLTAITIPSSVTSIGSSTFDGCTGLTSMTIPSSVTSIGGYAFYSCRGLTSVSIPSSVTSIGNSAFAYCSGLTSISIPSSVTSIGSDAFSSCSGLTSVIVPNSVTSIGGGAFYYCSGLTELTIPFIGTSPTATNEQFEVIFRTIPQSLKKVTITEPCTSIPRYAFNSWRGLTSVSIPSSVTSIGDHAFVDCSGLTSMTIPNSVTSIGDYAFRNCSGLTSMTIPNGVTSIGEGVFYDCSGLTSMTIPSTLTSIGKAAFFDCSGLTSISIPSLVTSIGNYAFGGCFGLTSISNHSSVTSIGDGVFSGCSGLTSITIPSSVTSIGLRAFYFCSGLTSISIPSSVISIGDEAFYYCYRLTSMIAANPIPVNLLSAYVFERVSKTDCTLYVPGGSKGAYQAANIWKDFIHIVEDPGLGGTTELLSVSSLQQAIGKEEASTATSIVSSNTSWAATSNQDWLTVSPASGTGNGTLIFTAKQNTIVAQRTATVTLAATGVNPVTITITQYAGNALLSVSSPQLVIGKEEASTATSIVTSNTSWAAKSNQDWLTVSPASGTGNATLTFTAKQNTAVAQRTATVTIASIWVNPVTITITQQAEDAFIITAQSLPLNGGTVTGFGEYARNAPVSLQAMPDDQYEFKGWKEGTTMISEAITYNFTAIASRKLYAVFTPKENADTSMTIIPQSSSASLVWSPVNGASNYLLIIYNDAACTQEVASYQIDASGKIINKSASTTETSESTVLSCSIDELASGKTYYYRLTSYDSNSQALSVSFGNFTTLITGINEVDAVIPKVFPSPTTGMVYIEATNKKAPSIKVYNLQGRLLLQTQGNEVDLSDCSNGTYLLQIDGQTIKVEKK